MTTETCAACRFLGPTGAKAPTCRRFPPTVHIVVASRQFQTNGAGLTGWTDNMQDASLWPSVSPNDWCGEFQPNAGARH